MKLYLSNDRVWTGTQADAKEAQGGPDFKTVEVPTDKPGLIEWLNREWSLWWAEFDQQAGSDRSQDAAPPVSSLPEPSPPPAPVRAPEPPVSGTVSEQIMALEGSALFVALQAAIDRLHEIAGPKGWQQFAKHVSGWGGGSSATDRGLGMLVLAGLASATKEEANAAV